MGKPEGKSGGNDGCGKAKKRKYLPYAKAAKKKGAYPLRPGVQGFFITCDGGRERQAAHEALNILDNFCEDGENSVIGSKTIPEKPLNKKIKFEDSDASSSDDNSHSDCQDQVDENKDDKEDNSSKRQRFDSEDTVNCVPLHRSVEKSDNESRTDPSGIDPRTDAELCNTRHKTEEKSIDELIDDELKELGDRNKRRFVSLDSGCNGVIFIQMHKRAGQPSPSKIAEQLLSLAASTKKHMSRFILRILPVEVSCYASEEEIKKAMKPLVSQYFSSEAPNPVKFAVLYDARANTGVDRMTIINAVAKSVPLPHKVDLSNPDQTIIVQIVKTVCLVGVVKRYKELAKYNLRQLTAPQK